MEETFMGTRLLKPDSAAKWLDTTNGALRQMRYLGIGPKYVVIGSRTIRYREQDLLDYVEQNLRTPAENAA